MLSNKELITNFEAKIKQLIIEQNANQNSGDNSSFALNSYFENAGRIDRLQLCIKQLRKREVSDVKN